MRLAKRKAAVTGAAQGIGEAIALRLALEGADVVILDRNLDGANDAARRIADASGRAIHALACDVTDEAGVASAIDTAAERLGGFDLFVNNAGVLKSHFLPEFPKADWDFVLGVNLTGAFLCLKHAARRMLAEGAGGAMTVIASRSAKRGGLWNHAYCASKFGVLGLVQCAALDLAPKGVRVNAVCPGNALDTPLWKDLAVQYARKYEKTPEEVLDMYRKRVPLGRGCDVADIASAVVFLSSPDSSYMTGQALNITGGEIMNP